MVVAVDGGPNQQEKTGVAKAEKRRAANGLADFFWTQDVICNGRFSEVEPTVTQRSICKMARWSADWRVSCAFWGGSSVDCRLHWLPPGTELLLILVSTCLTASTWSPSSQNRRHQHFNWPCACFLDHQGLENNNGKESTRSNGLDGSANWDW